jgi:hypothetical protein
MPNSAACSRSISVFASIRCWHTLGSSRRASASNASIIAMGIFALSIVQPVPSGPIDVAPFRVPAGRTRLRHALSHVLARVLDVQADVSRLASRSHCWGGLSLPHTPGNNYGPDEFT